MSELRPCPFCGNDAPRKRIQIDESLWSHAAVDWLTIVCDECDCQSVSSEVHTDVIAAWNRRTPEPPKERQMRAEFEAWVQDRGCDTDGAWSAWQACWNLRFGGSDAEAVAK
jgi:hypothetical protein